MLLDLTFKNIPFSFLKGKYNNSLNKPLFLAFSDLKSKCKIYLTR